MDLITYLGLNDLQIPHLYSRRGKVWNLELYLYRPLAFTRTDTTHGAAEAAHHASAFVVITTDRWKAKFGAHEELFTSTKLFDLPHNRCGLRSVVNGANVGSEAGRICVLWDRYDD